MVCDRWQLFANFHTDMGDRPHGKTLDRIDSNGHYEPSNCRWATIKEQTRNRGNNRLITFQGRTMPAISWAEEIGVHKNTLYSRLRRMSDEDALTLKLIKGAKAWKPPKLG